MALIVGFQIMNELGNKLDFSSMDAADPLARFREQFFMPRGADGEEVLYFTGNSLGLMPKMARSYVEQELRDWETLGVNAHMHAKNPWLSYHEFLTERMAAIIGAKPIETIMMNSLTVNLHFLLVSFYRPTTERYKIVIEKSAFPSDQYAVKSHLRFHGYGAGNRSSKFKVQSSESVLQLGTRNFELETNSRRCSSIGIRVSVF